MNGHIIPRHLEPMDLPWVAATIFFFILLTIFSFGPQGLLRRQTHLIFDTRNSRTFEEVSTITAIMRPLLMLQSFLFGGMCLLTVTEIDPLLGLFSQPSAWISCMLFSFGWFLLQLLMLRWTNYLFRLGENISILTRILSAIYLLSGPLFLLLYLLYATGCIDVLMMQFLTITLFICTQIIFIFNGIKIFLTGFGSLCFIILYLCTLEMAPLYVLYQKLMLWV